MFVGRADELAVLNDALARARAAAGRAAGAAARRRGGRRQDPPHRGVHRGGLRAGRRRRHRRLRRDRRGRTAVRPLLDGPARPAPPAPRRVRRRGRRPGGRARPAAARAGRGPAAGRGPRPHDEEGTARLFELTARLLERLAADRTVVLVLEDLHWADASTRHLLAYLFRTLRSGRLVVVATYRADDIHRRHPLRPLLAELDRLRTVRRIELARFSRDEVARQIAGILAPSPTRPWWTTSSTAPTATPSSSRNSPSPRTAAAAPSLTDSLRDLLLVRVEELPEDAQRVARIVAEGGSTVEYPLLAAVAGLAEDDLIEALRAAVGANILLATARRRRLPLPALPGPRGRQRRPAARRALPPQPPLRRGPGGRPLPRRRRRAGHPARQLLVPRARRGQGAARRARRLRRGPPPARLLRATAPAGAGDGAVGRRPRGRTRRPAPRSTTPRSTRPAAAIPRPPRCAIST